MPDDEPKWRRRKTARPAEIIAAALDVFVEKGFAASKLDDVARRAGIAKGTLYLYFETKEDLFRAVAQAAVAPNLDAVESAADAFEGPFAAVAPQLLKQVAAMMGSSRIPAVARMVIGERDFPDLARIWHDDVVAELWPCSRGSSPAPGKRRSGTRRSPSPCLFPDRTAGHGHAVSRGLRRRGIRSARSADPGRAARRHPAGRDADPARRTGARNDAQRRSDHRRRPDRPGASVWLAKLTASNASSTRRPAPAPPGLWPSRPARFPSSIANSIFPMPWSSTASRFRPSLGQGRSGGAPALRNHRHRADALSFLHMFPQDQHEQLLIERLQAQGRSIERQTELLGFTDEGDQVAARLDRTRH